MAKHKKTPSHISFCRQLKAAIDDERSAVPDYQGLMRNACAKKSRCKEFKPLLQGIIRDERKHKRKLEVKYDRYCR